MTESFREIPATSAPEAHEGKLTFAEMLSQAAANTDGRTITTPYIDNTLTHLHIDNSESLTQLSNSTLVGIGVESAAVSLWSGSGLTLSPEGSGKPLISLQLDDAMLGAVRGLAGTIGVNIVDNELSKYYKDDLLKPSLPETLAMGAAFGLSNTRLRLAAVGGSWLLGRAYNYVTGQVAQQGR